MTILKELSWKIGSNATFRAVHIHSFNVTGKTNCVILNLMGVTNKLG